MTDLPVVKKLVNSVSDPVLIISPKINKFVSVLEMMKIYEAIEAVLEKITSKIGVDFSITIASACDFNGYDNIDKMAIEQKDEAEEELWK